MLIIRLSLIIIWAVIGFLFWIPLLVRTVATYTGLIVYSAITGADISHASMQLDSASAFYARGFSNIYSQASGTEEQRRALRHRRPLTVDTTTTVIGFVMEVIWTLVFWAGVILPPVFHYVR